MDKRLLDKEWRINHLYQIRNEEGQKITYRPNRAQKDFEQNRHSRNIILKSRQLGFTTYESVDMLDDTLFNRNYDAIVIAHTDKDAIKIFQNKVNYAWDNFPLQQLYSVSTDKANELKFDFGDKTFSSMVVTGSGRSGTYRRVHISEFAKLCKMYPLRAEEVLTGTIPAVPFSGRIDIESTAEGEYGQFHDMFWSAWNRGEPQYPTDFKAHFYNWTWDDAKISKVTQENVKMFKASKDREFFEDYQKKHGLSDVEITYYFMQWLALDKKWYRLRQEFPFTPEEAFISSGNKVFEKEELDRMELREGRKDGGWTIYEEYVPGKKYVMGADVAEGVGQDSSTAVVLRLDTKAHVVATYSDNMIPPDIFAHELRRYAIAYGSCLVCPERNNHGHTTISKLKEIYPNIYKDEDERKQFEERSRLPKSPVKVLKYGWATTKTSKPHMISELREAINNQELDVPSRDLVFELRTYDKEDMGDVRFNPDATKHWDMVMALAIAYQMRTKNMGSEIDMNPVFYGGESYT